MKDYKVWRARGARDSHVSQKRRDPSTSLRAGYGAPAAGRDSHIKAPPCRKERDKDGAPSRLTTKAGCCYAEAL